MSRWGAPPAELVQHKITVLSVAFPYAPIGRKAVGGAEVICSEMEIALAEAEYASVVVAHEDSVPAGKLYGTCVPAGVITDELRDKVEATQQRKIDEALKENAVSLVHMHGLDFHRYHVPAGMPVLVTLHLPPGWYPETIWDLPENYHLVCVSETQKAACPDRAQGRLACIGNGVRLPDRSTLRDAGRYALMLARICPEKNLHVGLDAARAAAMPALLGGEVFPYEAHLRYFADEIEPRLTAEGNQHEARAGALATRCGARFLGAVAGDEKARLLSRAACLLLPSLAPETSSLVAMEALASGVPVVGMRVGAVPEIVEHGRTGFLIEPGEDAAGAMAEAIRHVGEIDRAVCRRSAEERFPLQRMVQAYLNLYRRLALEPSAAEDLQRRGIAKAEHVAAENSARGYDEAQLSAETITAAAAWERLVPEWETLWKADRHATPFQHPAWLMPWWRQFGPDGELQTISVRERGSGALVGLLPTYIYKAEDAAERQLLLVGAGTTDYLDGLWQQRGVAAAALRRLLETKEWDDLHFEQLRGGSALCAAAEAEGLEMGVGEPCAVLPCAQELPAKIRANVSRYRRRAEQMGQLSCRLALTPEEALADFDLLVEFNRERWEERGEDAVLNDERVQAHHRASLPWLLRVGLLRLFRLSLGGVAVGVLYGLADGEQVAERRLYLYLIGFHRQFAEVSPGTLLLHAAWTQAQQEQFTSVDMLRGGESYKQLWGAIPEGTTRAGLQRTRRER